MKFHEIFHPSYGSIKFSSEVINGSLILKSPNGEFIGQWDSEMGGGLRPVFGCSDEDDDGYMISEGLIYREVKSYGFLNDDPKFLELRDNLMNQRSKEVKSLIDILKSDPNIDLDDLNFQIREGTRNGIGFHTTIPTWDVDDLGMDWEDWTKSVSHFPNPGFAGLSDSTLKSIFKLGYLIIINECEGCENEGLVYRESDKG